MLAGVVGVVDVRGGGVVLRFAGVSGFAGTNARLGQMPQSTGCHQQGWSRDGANAPVKRRVTGKDGREIDQRVIRHKALPEQVLQMSLTLRARWRALGAQATMSGALLRP
jgi:hypothetical protein